MSVIRTTWSKLHLDNFNDIFRKEYQPKETHVRIAGVCDCAKCDPGSEVFKTKETSTKQ